MFATITGCKNKKAAAHTLSIRDGQRLSRKLSLRAGIGGNRGIVHGLRSHALDAECRQADRFA